MYACDVCGGKTDLVERCIDGITAGALVCDECGAVYPSYMIDSDIRVRMVYARGNPDEMERLKKSMNRKMRKNRRMFKSFGGMVMR